MSRGLHRRERADTKEKRGERQTSLGLISRHSASNFAEAQQAILCFSLERKHVPSHAICHNYIVRGVIFQRASRPCFKTVLRMLRMSTKVSERTCATACNYHEFIAPASCLLSHRFVRNHFYIFFFRFLFLLKRRRQTHQETF